MGKMNEILDYLVERGVLRRWRQLGSDYVIETFEDLITLTEHEILIYVRGAFVGMASKAVPSDEVLRLAERLLDGLESDGAISGWSRDAENCTIVRPLRGERVEVDGDELFAWVRGVSFGQALESEVPTKDLSRIRQSLIGLREQGILTSWEVDVDDDSLTVWRADGESTWVPLHHGLSFLDGLIFV